MAIKKIIFALLLSVSFFSAKAQIDTTVYAVVSSNYFLNKIQDPSFPLYFSNKQIDTAYYTSYMKHYDSVYSNGWYFKFIPVSNDSVRSLYPILINTTGK